MTSIRAEKDGKRIFVTFDYDPAAVEKIRTIAGRRFLREPRKGWSLPLDMTVCRQLRALFGDDLHVGERLRAWAWEAVQSESRLGAVAMASHGNLPVLKDKLPTLWRALYFGPLGKHALEHGITNEELDAAERVFSFIAGVPPWEHGSYQTADVRFLADAPAPLNANHQGLGKTPESIAEIYEAGREEGWHLVIAPSAAVDGTWEPELEKWLAGQEVGIFACYGNRTRREAVLDDAFNSTAKTKFVVVNPAMIAYRKDPMNLGQMAIPAKEREYREACKCDRLKAAHWHYEPSYPELFKVKWATIINDEVHKGNIRNHRSITGRSMGELDIDRGGKKVALSGTPMKKKGADIWGVLHWLRPDVFTSYWNFARMFFNIEENPFGMKVGVLREEMEEEFYRYLIPYVVRRTKDEALPWLPAKMHVPVVVTLGEKQRKQYDKMEADGIASFDEEGSGAIEMTSTLAEFTRMQQFANAYHVRGFRPDLENSAKVDALFEKLDEAGILDGSSDEKVVIFSRFREMLDALQTKLAKAGVRMGYIKGGMKERRGWMEKFQTGDLNVMLVVTSAGGVSLTLDAADTAHFLEPNWAPDEQEQAEDRLHRASRMHQVTIFTYIARDTIDEYVTEVAFGKAEQHARILDIRRKLVSDRSAQ